MASDTTRRRRRRTWTIFVIALLPLTALLGLQFLWLDRLEKASADAHRATLANYLEAVSSAVELHYRSLGERVLNLPAAVLAPDRIFKAPYYFQKKDPKEVLRLFVVTFSGPDEGRPLFYAPGTTEPMRPEPAEMRAVLVAIAPWRILALKGGTLARAELQVEEGDPAHRIILNPITDDAGRVMGAAGLIVDPRHFEDVVLKGAVKTTLGRISERPADQDLLPVVTARDGAGRSIHYGQATPERAAESTRRLSFVFSDWELAIHSRHYTPATWARRNFAINLALSLLLTALVAGGVVFALNAAARALRLSEMKSDFVSNVSHELRTPLASIRVFGELLRLGKVDSPEKVREYGEYIETESRRLTQLIDNILDLARIESGRKTYDFAEADLEALVGEALRTFRPRLEQAGFRVSLRGPETGALPRLRLDAAAVAQSLANLLDNAAKYSALKGAAQGTDDAPAGLPAEARDIEVTVSRQGDFAAITVADHGIGIPAEEQKKIFDRFHRVATGASGLVHDVKGSGLGLAIVRHVAHAHGGRVEVESRLGEGSQFTLLLPLHGAPGAAGSPSNQPVERTAEG